jgi:hypothetical protein
VNQQTTTSTALNVATLRINALWLVSGGKKKLLAIINTA